MEKELQNIESFVRQLELGRMPNFLEVMAAISAVSDLYPDTDSGCVCSAQRTNSCPSDPNYPQPPPGQRCQNCS